MIKIKNNNFFLVITSIILVMLLFSSLLFYFIQKNNKKATSISDCEVMQEVIKKQECIIEAAERISSYNVKKAVDLCNTIEDNTIRDICFFQIAQKIDFSDPAIEKRGITCESANSSTWQEYCNRVKSRPHLAK